MKHPVRTLIAAVALAVAGAAQAAPITMTFDFSGGFDLSVNGGAAQASGAVVFTVNLDSSTPDLDPSNTRGRFATQSVMLTASSLGIFNQSVVAPSPLFVDTFSGGLTIIGAGFDPDIGWNGGPGPASFMGDINDLDTLPLPTAVAMTSTFFLRTITLLDGTTLEGNTGGGGPTGQFSVAATNRVSEPGALALAGLSLFAAGMAARRRTAAR